MTGSAGCSERSTLAQSRAHFAGEENAHVAPETPAVGLSRCMHKDKKPPAQATSRRMFYIPDRSVMHGDGFVILEHHTRKVEARQSLAGALDYPGVIVASISSPDRCSPAQLEQSRWRPIAPRTADLGAHLPRPAGQCHADSCC